MKRREKILIGFSIIFVLIVLYLILLIVTPGQYPSYLHHFSGQNIFERLGWVGSFAQVAAMLFSAIGLIYIYKTYKAQREELELMRKEVKSVNTQIELTKNEYTRQGNYLANQEIETRFFKLMDLLFNYKSSLVYGDKKGDIVVTEFCKRIETSFSSGYDIGNFFLEHCTGYINILNQILNEFASNSTFILYVRTFISVDDQRLLAYSLIIFGNHGISIDTQISLYQETKILDGLSIDKDQIFDRLNSDQQHLLCSLGMKAIINPRSILLKKHTTF